MSHELLLTSGCWTVKNLAKTISELVKVKEELARVFRIL